MQPYINALTLKFDGQDGVDAPTKPQVAATWCTVGILAMLILK